jgi:ATP-dependent protease ClpP protease subunit
VAHFLGERMKDYDWSLNRLANAKEKVPYESCDSEEFNLVEVAANKIYFYSTVSRPKILKLNKSISNISAALEIRGKTYSHAPGRIQLHINSYGGSVFAALAAVDYIRTSEVPIDTVIEGCAASAATLISVVGSRRRIHKNACMLIHQLSGHMWGKFEEMKDDMENSQLLMKKIKNIYKEYARIPDDVLGDILKRDLWWDAEMCLNYGLVDEII